MRQLTITGNHLRRPSNQIILEICLTHSMIIWQYMVSVGVIMKTGVTEGCVFLIGMTCRLCLADCPGIGSVWVFRSISGVTDRDTCWSVTVMADLWGRIGDGALLPGP